jgi:AcrR family transcriptional regulator
MASKKKPSRREPLSMELPQGRHMEILQQALKLVADRGYAGASLRELARRVNMSQPSLYHYFDSKDALVEQCLLFCGAELLTRQGFSGFPETLLDVPQFIVDYLRNLYGNPEYATFMRFMFAVAPQKQKYRNAIRRIYEEGFETITPALMAPFVERGEIAEADALPFMRLLINGLGLLLMERRVLYAEKEDSADTEAYARWMVDMLRGWLQERQVRR